MTYTVEPPHIIDILGPAILSFMERLSSLWKLKCTSITGTSHIVLYGEVVLYSEVKMY